MTEIIVEPFSWDDNFSEVAQEDFSLIQHTLLYGVTTSIGMALAKLKLLEEQGCKVEPNEGEWILTDVERDRVWHCNCSKCNKDPLDLYVGGSEDWWLIKTKLPKFCPNCGAKMGSEVMK